MALPDATLPERPVQKNVDTYYRDVTLEDPTDERFIKCFEVYKPELIEYGVTLENASEKELIFVDSMPRFLIRDELAGVISGKVYGGLVILEKYLPTKLRPWFDIVKMLQSELKLVESIPDGSILCPIVSIASVVIPQKVFNDPAIKVLTNTKCGPNILILPKSNFVVNKSLETIADLLLRLAKTHNRLERSNNKDIKIVSSHREANKVMAEKLDDLAKSEN